MKEMNQDTNDNVLIPPSVICFMNSITEEEKTSLTIKELIQKYDTIKKDNDKKRKRIPRPMNSFILYRRDKNTEFINKGIKMDNSELSKTLGKMWREEPEEIREYYQKLSREASKQHKRMYPNYRYKPRKHREIRRRSKKNEEESVKEKKKNQEKEEMVTYDELTKTSKENIDIDTNIVLKEETVNYENINYENINIQEYPLMFLNDENQYFDMNNMIYDENYLYDLENNNIFYPGFLL
jgi:hypothetical protein